MNPILEQLSTNFAQLQEQIKELNLKPQQWFRRSDLFHSNAFNTQSDDIFEYLAELNGNIQRLGRSTNLQRTEFLAEQVQTQFACLKNLLNSAGVNHKAKRYEKDHVKRIRQVQNLAKRVNKDSQQLYTELSELKEFERRLEEMVADKQTQLNQYGGAKFKQEYQQQVLATQQRLGRCRQAISKVEEQIQQLDNK